MSKIKDIKGCIGKYSLSDTIKLKKQGELKIEWAESRMPVLMKIKERFNKEKPLKGIRVSCCLHVTKETAVLMRTLKAGGAKVFLCGSNPLSTQDDIAAALSKEIEVFAWRGVNKEEYYWCINKVLKSAPQITTDDGGDLITQIHLKRKDLIKNILGGTEETTTGVMRFRAMEKAGVLKYPVIAVNDADSKYLFDNRYGTGQSTIDGILRSTSILISGKKFVICGYGWCGKGIAKRAKGMGASVIVCEVKPLRALEAVMDGFQVMPMSAAAKIGDIFVTVTGDKDVITKGHMIKMKDGAVLANSGHFNVEINTGDLEKISKGKRKIRENLEEFTLENNRKIYLLGEGRLINLAAAEGHPSEVMDMSFSLQALSVEYLTKEKGLKPKVYKVPEKIDSDVSKLKLETIGVKIDKLSEEQEKYLESFGEGTE